MQTVIRCFALLGLIVLMPPAGYGQDSDGLSTAQRQAQNQLQRQIENQSSSIAEQREDIATLKKYVEELDAQNKRLNDELSQARTSTTAAVADLKKTQQAAADANQANQQQLQSQVQGLEGTLTQQNSLIVEQKASLENLDKRHTDLSKELQVKTKSTMESIQTVAKELEGRIVGKMEGRITDVKNTFTPGVNTNIVWTLVTGYLVMFMQAGFAMVECGFSRTKNAAHTAMLNFMIYSLGMMGYWVCGFAFQFGGTGAVGPGTTDLSVSTVASLGSVVPAVLNQEWGFHWGEMKFGLLGGSGFFLWGNSFDPGIFTLFLFQMVFMDTTAIIPTGALAERWKFYSFCIYGFCVGAFMYPVFGNWVWGGGWLAAMGHNWGLGHGHVDFAGSSVVHVAGGTIAFVGAWMLGPRIGKYNADGSPNPIPGSNIPMAILGTFILAFGWFGFNPGSTLSAMDPQIGVIATNTMLASGAGAVTGMLVAWLRIGKPDPSFACNGMLAGLVAITGPCAFVDAWAAVFIGVGAAIVMYCAVFFVEEELKIDDPAGAISVHGMAGIWGEFCLGLFANGKYGDGWNGVPGTVKGVFYGDYTQLIAEMIGASTCVLWFGLSSFCVFTVIGKLVGNRVSAETEMEGLDGPEIGVLGYTTSK